MTTQKSFKRRVRARMAKTGESYTAARRQLIASGDAPDPGTPTYETVVSDDKMLEATGKRHEDWFAVLDAWGAKDRTHTEIARHVHVDLGVDGWWAQSITVGYERARGLRAVGQMKDGWTINASKTVDVAVDRLFDSVVAHERLPDVDTGDEMKAYWRAALTDLKTWLEGAPRDDPPARRPRAPARSSRRG